MPVVAQLDGRFVEGFVDLIVEGVDGLVVVDYKTDAALNDDASRQAKVAHYTPQLQAYVACVETATGLPVAGAVLLFISEHSCVAEAVATRRIDGHSAALH